MLRKIRHLIELSIKRFIIVYTDHDAVLNIFKQISMTTTSIDKLNLRLVRAFNYIQRFDLKLRHKLNKAYIISDALFKFLSINTDTTHEKDKLNALFITAVVDLNKVFRKKIINKYNIDFN